MCPTKVPVHQKAFPHPRIDTALGVPTQWSAVKNFSTLLAAKLPTLRPSRASGLPCCGNTNKMFTTRLLTLRPSRASSRTTPQSPKPNCSHQSFCPSSSHRTWDSTNQNVHIANDIHPSTPSSDHMGCAASQSLRKGATRSPHCSPIIIMR